jgi:hypothetical protein
MIGSADMMATYSFFNEALRIREQETDVLRARQKSTGITAQIS